MNFLNLVLLAWFQVQSPTLTVVVGLADGQQLLLQNPRFTGFIEDREGDAALMYRQPNFHGELSLKSVSRIDFGEYKKGKPFPLTVTLKGGQKIQVESERRDFLTIKGSTDLGQITVKHPDPLSVPIRLSTGSPNRKDSLTILYLEFPGS